MPVIPEVDWDHLTEEQERLFVEALRMFARRGRKLREAEEGIVAKPDTDDATNAAYEGMTPEERGIAVYQKWAAEELPIEKMTRLEGDSWYGEGRRQSQLTWNIIWNAEHHRYLLDRIESISDKLTEDEQKAVIELMQSCRWGRAEVEQVKEIIETAEWFGRLTSGQPPR